MPHDRDRLDLQAITQEARDAFRSYQWCKPILSDNSLIPVRTNSDRVSPHVTHTFMRKTLPSEHAVVYWQSFYNPNDPEPSLDTESRPTGQYWTLYALGKGGEGHAGVAHGGLVSTLLDQGMGNWITSHSRLSNAHTAYLHVKFLATMRTPSVVLSRAWITSVEGRKVKLSAVLEGEGGAKIASADALFITNTPKL